jgi:hypothetical protein
MSFLLASRRAWSCAQTRDQSQWLEKEIKRIAYIPDYNIGFKNRCGHSTLRLVGKPNTWGIVPAALSAAIARSTSG